MEIFDLSGRVAVITGGSRGIGLAIAEGLASAGAAVVISNRTAAEGEEAAAKLRRKNLKAEAIPVDVSRRGSVEALVSAVLKKFQKIDILVNSAAVILRKPIEDITDEEWNSLLDVNLRGVFLCCQVVGREMIKRQQGKIINISSNVAQVLQPGRGVYAVTKAGVSHLTRVLAFEWAPHHIQRECHRARADDNRTEPEILRGAPGRFDRPGFNPCPWGGWASPQTTLASPCSWLHRHRTSSPGRRYSWTGDRF